MLEPYAGKLASTVLRGGGGGNVTSLPDSCSSTARTCVSAFFSRSPTRRGRTLATWLQLKLKAKTRSRNCACSLRRMALA